MDIARAGDVDFAVLAHDQGNGGCLVPMHPDQIVGDRGLPLYLNVGGRLHDGEAQVVAHRAEVLQGSHAIGPHGFRAVVRDSEGSRIVLHSMADA